MNGILKITDDNDKHFSFNCYFEIMKAQCLKYHVCISWELCFCKYATQQKSRKVISVNNALCLKPTFQNWSFVVVILDTYLFLQL